MKKQVTIHDGKDNAITVDIAFYKGMPGRREFGAPIEPDDDDEIEIIEAWDENGIAVELTDEQEEMAIDEFNK